MKSYLFISILALISFSCVSIKDNSRPHFSDFESEYRELMDSMNIIGVSLAVVRDNEIAYSNQFGYKDLKTKEPIDENSLFIIASISKSFMATAIMHLYETGKLDIYADVNKYLPFSLRNPNFPNDSITIEMLLCHTSSVNDSQGYKHDFNAINPKISGTTISKCFNDYKPGTKYSYSNYNSNILGCVIENVLGRPWWEYIVETVIKPLGLNADYNVDNLNPDLFTNLYYWDGKKYSLTSKAYARPAALDDYKLCVDSPQLSAEAGMKISAIDLARYMLMHMNYGKSPKSKHRIISEKSSKDMQRVHVDASKYGGAKYGLGLYQSVSYIPNKVLIGHNGRAYGAHTAMFFDPEKKYGFIVLCNGAHDDKFIKESIILMNKYFISNS